MRSQTFKAFVAYFLTVWAYMLSPLKEMHLSWSLTLFEALIAPVLLPLYCILFIGFHWMVFVPFLMACVFLVFAVIWKPVRGKLLYASLLTFCVGGYFSVGLIASV